MWPLSLVLLVAIAAPQQGPANLQGDYVGKVPQIKSALGKVPQPNGQGGHAVPSRRVSPDDLQAKNTCYTLRSYHFERHDGQAPALTGVSTCTPANKLQQRQVSPSPGVLYVPMGLQMDGPK